MTNKLERKNVLIVPLALFIKYNKKRAAEKFANIFINMTHEFFSTPKEKAEKDCFKKYQQFNEKCVQKILDLELTADFKLGKKNKDEFISELLSFLKLDGYQSKKKEIEEAWNSLIELNTKSSAEFYALMKLTLHRKSIYFIGDTNELHAKKILDLFPCPPLEQITFLENLPNPERVTYSKLNTDGSDPSIGSIYFCLSYAYNALIEKPGLISMFFPSKQAPGLLTHLKGHLDKINTAKDDILLVSPGQKQQAIAKRLSLETTSKEKFYSSLLEMPYTFSKLTHSSRVNTHLAPTPAIPAPNKDKRVTFR
jgi:hypothetical protein